MSDEDTWSQECYRLFFVDLPEQVAIDSETTGLTWKDAAFGVSMAWYRGEELISGYIDLRYYPHLWVEVKEWIKTYKPELIFHNAKFDMHKLGLYPNNFQDTCLIIYLLNEHYTKKLKELARRILKEETDENTVVKETRRKLKLTREDGYDKLPLSVVAPYAIKDAEYTLRLYHRLKDKIAEEEDLAQVYSVEKQLLLCVAGTERRGMAIDVPYVKSQIIELGDEILQIEREISDIVGKPVGRGANIKVRDGEYKNGNPRYRTEKVNEFNPDSPDQVLAYFNSVGVEVSKTSKDALEGRLTPPSERAKPATYRTQAEIHLHDSDGRRERGWNHSSQL